MSLASKLRQLRQDRGWSMGELSIRTASEANERVSVSTISRLEDGQMDKVSAYILSKLAKGLSVDVRALYKAAGWYSSPTSDQPHFLTREERKLIDTIRSAPTAHFRQQLLERLKELAQVARDADADRYRQADLRRVADEKAPFPEVSSE